MNTLPPPRVGAGTPGLIARNTLVRSVGEIVAKVASLLFFVTMARELGREGFGAFMFALGLTGALIIGSGFGTDELTARDVARDHTRAGRYLSNVAAIKVVSALALLGVAALVVAIGDYSAETRLAVYLVGAGVALEVVARTWQAVFQAYERLDLVSLSVIVQRTLTAIAGIAVLKAGGGVVSASIVFVAGAVAGLLVAEVSVRRLGIRHAALQPGLWWGLVRAGIPIGIASVLFLLLLRLDVSLLSFLAGQAEVGLYAAAYRLTESTQFVPWALTGAMLPWLAREGRGSVGRGLELALKAMNAMLVPIGLGFVLFAESLIGALYGSAFEGSVLPLRLLGFTSVLYGVQALAGTTFIARDAPAAFAWLVGPVVLVNLVANLVLIPHYGADGAAATALASSVLLAALSLVFVQRRVGRLRLVHAFAGPLAAGAVMALVAVALPGPALPRAVVAVVAYTVAFAAFELTAFRQDALALLAALPPRVRSRLRLT